MADRSGARGKRPRWVRFAKAASKDLARDIYLAASKRGLDVGFAACTTCSTRPSSGTASWTTVGSATGGDGSMTDVYACLSGFLQQLELSEMDCGLVAMMTYGLMKAKDLELLPTTWRGLLLAALRMALLHLTSKSESTRAAERLRTIVEPWRPSWRRDYDLFSQRGSARSLIAEAMTAAAEMQKAPTYRDTDLEWDRELRAKQEEDSDEELASI